MKAPPFLPFATIILILSSLLTNAQQWSIGDTGVDRPGNDLAGSPILLSTSNTTPCFDLCASTLGCVVWSLSNLCGSPPFNCSLKFNAPNATNNSCITSGFAPRTLALRPHEPLSVSTIIPTGWLRSQLQLEAEGLTGHLLDFYPDVANSSWIGGVLAHQNTERFPYWFNGVVPLAHQLGDTRLLALIDTCIDSILQMIPPSGWLGPDTDIGDHIYWNKYKMLLALSSQYEATRDTRLPTVMIAHLKEMANRMWAQGLGTVWSASRVEDLAVTVSWLVEHGGDAGKEAAPWLWDFADRLHARRGNFDWTSFFGGSAFPEGTVSVSSLGAIGRNGQHGLYHGVDAAEALKSGAVWWRYSHDAGLLASSESRVSRVEAAHGLPTGELCADEMFCGTMPSHGTEICVIVEMIASYSVIAAATSDAIWYERIERLALNALPGAFTKDMWHHPYLHQANEIRAVNVSEHPWLTDGDAANTYGVDGGGTGCCTTNGGTGWPSATGAAVRTITDGSGGIALALLLPLIANATLIDGTIVTLTVDTLYPFDDIVNIKIEGVPTTHWQGGGMPFDIRIPSWATAATSLVINGGAPIPVGTLSAGKFFRILLPAGTNTLILDTAPTIRLSSWYNGAVAVERGALVYSLQLEENVTITKEWGYPNATDLNVTTTSPWNYALLVNDLTNPSLSFNFTRRGLPGPLPFAGGNQVPLIITAWGRRVSNWGEELNAAAPPPSSPACAVPNSCGSPELITLVPHGSTLLRITEFPIA